MRVLVCAGFHRELIVTFKAANVRWSKKSVLKGVWEWEWVWVWERCSSALQIMIRSIFLFLDRTYVLQNSMLPSIW